MGTAITTEKLRDFFAREPASAFVIEGTVQTDDTWYLGQVGIHRHQPLFRFACYIGLSADTHFRLHPFSEEEVGFDGIAIVLHQFTSSRFQDSPSEELAGWVPPAMSERAAARVEEGNRRIQERLAAKGQPATR